MSDRKIDKKEGRNKKFSKKSKKFVLSEYDQMIVDATDEKLKELVTKELEEQIASLIVRVNELNSTKSDVEKKQENSEVEKEEDKVELDKKDKNSTKKNVVLKLRKFKKCLSDENEIKKRVKLLKTKRRKLRKIVEKVQEKIKNLMKKKLRCFKCRKRGHTVADCNEAEVTPSDSGKTVQVKEDEDIVEDEDDKESKKKNIKQAPKVISAILCYNCGSTTHSVHGCSTKVDYANLPFAECFICKNKGHLSSACPTSNKGIYVRGGCCFICRKKDHLAKNCPQKQIEIEEFNNNHQLLNRKRRNFSENKSNPHNETDNKQRQFRDTGKSFQRGRGGKPTNRSTFIKTSKK